MLKKNAIYDKCAHIPTSIPDYKVDEEIVKEISSNFRTLPTFEKSLYEQVYIKHYSMQQNEKLRCRWFAYIHNVESRVFAPFYFPCIRDIHFHNCAIRFLPKENMYQKDCRMKLKPGPGVDYGGQMPIPQEFLMKRSGYVKEDKETKNITKSAVIQKK